MPERPPPMMRTSKCSAAMKRRRYARSGAIESGETLTRWREFQSFGARQREGECRALAERALHRDLTIHRLHEVLHDREPEPGAAERTRARAVDAVEALEDARCVLVRDADPGVGDRDAHAAEALLHGD